MQYLMRYMYHQLATIIAWTHGTVLLMAACKSSRPIVTVAMGGAALGVNVDPLDYISMVIVNVMHII